MPPGHSSRPAPEATTAQQPLLSDRYRLEAVLGQGGVGTVWRARDLQLDRDVAVKQLQPGVARDPAAADRFRREATTAASLSHPSLVTIYDVGEDDGAVYLVMELVEGPSVKDVLAAGGPLEPGEVAALGHRIARALVTVHERGLVHRDIKPGNVLLPVDGPAKLVDFGTIHVLGDAAANLTMPGTMMGTIGYVAPEQFEGQEITPRADVYAVGLLLNEALTGEPTFGSGTVAELTRRRLTDDAEPPSRRRPDVPPELDEIIVRATLREPAQRFADAGALAAALGPLVPGDGDGRLRALARQYATHARGRTSPTVPADVPDDLEETTVLPRADEEPAVTTPLPRGSAAATTPPTPVAVPDHHDEREATSVLPTVTGDQAPPPPVAPPPPPPAGEPPVGHRRILRPVLAVGLVAAVVAVVALGARNGSTGDGQGDGSNGGDGSGGGGGGATAVEIVGGQDFDPFGGGSEHRDDVPLAFDGDPATRWDTEGYNSPTQDKPGVGLWVQAANGTQPTRVEVDLAIPGADVEIYALEAPPSGDPASWGEPVGTAAGAEGTLAHDLPEGTRVVLVWFTGLGPDSEGGRHRGGISEIRLAS